MADSSAPLDVIDVARQLAASLDQHGQDYALGGAIALGYWANPRGTLDVVLTLFLPPDRPGECIWLHSTLWRGQPEQRPRFDPAFWGPRGIEQIHEETFGWPNFVQLVAQVLVDRANDDGLESLEAEHLEWAFDKAIGTAHSTLARIVKDECRLPGEWEYLTGFRRADQQPLPTNDEVLCSLRRRLMVAVDGNHCRMLVPLMQRWLRERG